MTDFPIDPPLVVKDAPKPLRLHSIDQALAFVDGMMHMGRPPPWRDVQHRLAVVSSPDEAVEAAGALRELLDMEHLLQPPALPLELPGGAKH
jgi:hypothetical protein